MITDVTTPCFSCLPACRLGHECTPGSADLLQMVSTSAALEPLLHGRTASTQFDYRSIAFNFDDPLVPGALQPVIQVQIYLGVLHN